MLVALFYPNQFPMEKFLLLLQLTALLLLCIFQFTNSVRMEAQALLEFKKQLKDPLNHLESWNENQSPCLFVGITCDSVSNNVVIGISLINMSLSGHLSASLTGLQSLSSLELQTNSISGTIPSELANCTNLQLLNLSSNTFTGLLPDLSSLRKLRALDLSTNKFYGSFPTWVGKLSGLGHLGLAQNNFDGEIPQGIGNLRNLTWLYLAQCNLTGEIPSSIFDLSSLGTFDLSQNKISGKFPNEISKLRSVWKIELYQNKLTGEIPAEVATLTNLREFDISHNQMNGKIPPEIGNMNFTVFQIFENNFWGELPEGFGYMQHLNSFSIYGNNFSGEFPASFGRYSPLTSFDISENRFSGPFPRYLCQNNNLQYLLALDNKFSGEFPDSYANCKTLLRFRISQNFFTGKVPDGLWGLPFAVIIDVADNGFIGGISSDIGISTSLTQLYVQNNKFSAALPAEIGMPSPLQKIFAYNNSFSGHIPSQIGDLNQLTSLHLEMNSLTGPIPAEIGMCSSLVDLDLAHNSLNGEIPGKIASLTSLNSLHLSDNMLIGSIPVGLQFLKLSSIDLSQNQLSGRVPKQLLMIAGDGAFAGNPGLCIDENTGSCNLIRGQKGAYGRRMDLILIIMLTLFVLLAGIAFVSYKSFKLEESCRKVDIEDGMDDYSDCKLDAFYPTELDAEEICNLGEENLIGSGGTGKVYRLDLNKNRGTFAVKHLWNGKDAKLVMSEISILGNIRHRNILKLCACLTRGDSTYLVFEYMPNGDLYQALHREIKDGKSELDWNRRYNIALGAAKGIMYLHHDCSPAIVHRDIKSTNILLDEEYEAKIADFGIAKVAEDSDNSCFAGTHGYMAPELAYSLKLTEKSDVYSFGVVLLELLTGRSPVTPQFGEGKDIVYWVSTHLEAQEVQDMFDPRVSKFAADDMIKVLKVAILCTTKLPSLRPSMREVVNMLIKADPCLGDNRGKHYAKNC